MDLLSAHRQGLVELIEAEAEGLAGAAGALAQRAIVYVHLYEQGGQAHDLALLAARGALDLPRALGALRRQARRWWQPRRRRLSAEALDAFCALALDIERRRCVAMVRAFRLAATPALAGDASATLGQPLVDAFAPCLAARREGGIDAETRWALFDAHDLWLAAQLAPLLAEAEALVATGLSPRAVTRVLEGLRVTAEAWGRAERKGWARVRAELLRDPALPNGFAINPGRFYFRLQNQVAERRRREWVRHIDPADSVQIAA